jgi:hypothetical protein
MRERFEIVNPLTYPHWNELVTTAEDYSFFHSENWAKVLHESYGYIPAYLSIIENCKLQTLIPVMEVRSMLTGMRGVSLPFTDYCEPIFLAGSSPEAALNRLIDHGKEAGWKYLELRGQRYFSQEIPGHSCYYHHTLPLTADEEQIAAGFKRFTVKNIRKASRSGIDVTKHSTLDAMKDFFTMHCKIRKLHGVPPQPFSFFRKIHEHVIAKGHGTLFLASYEGKYIAGGIFCHFGDRVIFKYSASERQYQSLRANNILIWTAIRHYAKDDYKLMSFGRTDLNAEGLREFKNAWGTTEHIIKYYHYDLGKDKFVTHYAQSRETYSRIFSKLPIPLLKIAGTLLYRHVG